MQKIFCLGIVVNDGLSSACSPLYSNEVEAFKPMVVDPYSSANLKKTESYKISQLKMLHSHKREEKESLIYFGI